MKPMMLTALGSENNFATGGTSFYLVFNGGELRVPVSEDAAEVVIAKIYSQQVETPAATTENQPDEDLPEPEPTNTISSEDDGVDQV
jgi:hypothetical protein